MKFLRIFAFIVISFAVIQNIDAATFTVTVFQDTNDGTCDADCSLREAVNAANASPEADVVNFPQLFDFGTITLSGTDIIITNSGGLTINGAGTNLTVSGNNASRIFTNNTGAVTVIRNMTLSGGNGVSTVTTGRGGAIYNNGGTLTLENLRINGNTAANGGGVNNAGTATLNIINCIISNNTATGSGGGLQNFAGNTTNIRNSAIHNNTSNSTTTGGGAMQANGVVNISNTTFANNNAVGGSGGAIYYNGTGLNMTNVTIAANTSTANGGGIHKATATLNAFLRNNIIAGNNGAAGSPDITGAFNSEGNNIIGNVGTSTAWVASDLQNTNPMLGAFGNNGGFGNTFLPSAGSPAINAGQNCVVDLTCSANNPVTALSYDQRGISRTFNGNVDIGAVEVARAVDVTISGRVTDSSGNGVRNATVYIATNEVLNVTKTNAFGYYTLGNIQNGARVLVEVRRTKYAFYLSQSIIANGNVSNLDFVPFTVFGR